MSNAPFADEALLRFVFSEAMQPVIADVMCWTHSTEAPSITFLSPAPHILPPRSPTASTSFTTPQQGSTVLSCGLFKPLPRANVHLPNFLKPLREAVLVAGYQLRFLSHLSQSKGHVTALVHSAAQQIKMLRAVVMIRSGEVPDGPGVLDRPPVHSAFGATVQERWLVGLAWKWDTVLVMEKICSTAACEREALVSSMLSDLQAQRQALANEHLAGMLKMLQARQAESVQREQEKQQAEEREHLRKMDMLQQMQLEVNMRDRCRKVRLCP
jgi:hypothetical protein